MRHAVTEVHASDHDACLARLRAEVIDGKDTSNQAALVGTVLHRVAEDLAFTRARDPSADPRAVAASALRDEAKSLGMSPAAVVDALGILTKLLAPDSRIELRVGDGWNGRPEVAWALSEAMAVIEPGTEPAIAAGRIDLIEWKGPKLRLTDWKSEQKMRSHADAAEDFQARLYSFWALRAFPDAGEVEFRFAELRHGYFARATFKRGDVWEWATEQQVRASHAARVAALAADVWPETTGPWCRYCPVRFKCSALGLLREQGAVPEDVADGQLAREREALKVISKDYEERVAARFENDESPIPLGDPRGTVLGYKPGQAWEIAEDANGADMPYEDVMARLRAFGMTPAQESEAFRFCAAHHFPGRVRDVLADLRVSDEERERIVVPITRTTLTTYRPDPKKAPPASVSVEELDALLDTAFS